MASPLARNAAAAFQRGQWALAESICAGILAGNPRDVQALTISGNVAAILGDMAKAQALFERARAASPRDAAVLNSLGGAYAVNGRLADARAALEAAVAIDPHYPWARQNLAGVLLEEGELDAARGELEAALRAKPDYAEAVAGLADIAEKTHDLDGAQALAQRALRLAPGLAAARIVAARVHLRRRAYREAIGALEGLTANEQMRPANRAIALNLTGQAHEKLGDGARAFAAFAGANAIRRGMFAPKFETARTAMSPDTLRRLLSFIEAEDAGRWSAAPAGGEEPVFFVGFPRSGTTLLEQILASHPAIEVAEEPEALADSFEPLILAPGALARWKDLSAGEIESLRAAYWRRIDASLGRTRSGRLFVDKLPLNTAMLPLIHRLFPRAKIIFAVRDPRDVVVSCFAQNFAMNASMFQFLSLDSAVRYYDLVTSVGEAARRRLPLNVHVVRYEDLIVDFDRVVGDVLSFLGLAWSDEVRSYALTARKRRIRTPSGPQVVEALYASSIGRWRLYAKEIEPHAAVLQRWVTAFGYAG